MTNIIAPDIPARNRAVAIFELYTFWPTTVPVPSSFEVKQSVWTLKETGQCEGHYPLALVTLPNGAAVKIELIDPFDLDSRHEDYSGRWHDYIGGDMELRNSLSDVLHYVFLKLICESGD